MYNMSWGFPTIHKNKKMRFQIVGTFQRKLSSFSQINSKGAVDHIKMASAIDSVSGPLHMFWLVGGFPLTPKDGNWNKCSQFEARKSRLIWCYLTYSTLLAVLQGIAWVSMLQEKPIEFFFNLGKSGIWPDYGMTETDTIIFFGVAGALIKTTYVYIYLLYLASDDFSELCYSMTKLTSTLTDDAEARKIAQSNLKEVAVLYLVMVVFVPPVMFLAWYEMLYVQEGLDLGRVIAWAGCIVLSYVLFLASLPMISGFLIFRQSVMVVKAMVVIYSKEIIIQGQQGLERKLQRKQSQHWSHQVTETPPPSFKSNINSRQSSVSPVMARSVSDVKIDVMSNVTVLGNIGNMLEIGNELTNILDQINTTFSLLLCADTIIVLVQATCHLYVFISQILVIALTTPKSIVFAISVSAMYFLGGGHFTYKLMLLIGCSSDLEDEVENLWGALREVSALRFREMTLQQQHELSCLRDKIHHMMSSGLIQPKGLFHLGRGLIVGIFTTVTGYFLILIGFRTNEIGSVSPSSNTTSVHGLLNCSAFST